MRAPIAPRTDRSRIEDLSFLALVILITLAFGWVVEPFFGAILWALVAAILFAPMSRALLSALPGHRNSAAALTLIVIVALVIVPAIILGMALLQEATTVYARIRSGEWDVAALYRDFQDILPNWAMSWLRRLGLTNFATAREMLGAGAASGVRTLAAQAFSVGQGAFSFLVALGVMLYLTFFLLRDGDRLTLRVARAVPLHEHQRMALAAKFVAVIRATIKGSIVVAIVQGLIGGGVFYLLGIPGALLWGVMMGFFSLLPAIGTGLVWVPVAIYLFVTGTIWQGVALVLCGVLVIGMVDNILRPILVGRDTRMPDYVVLISTLGGIEAFGFNGFVIGPVIAALFIAAWDIMTDARRGVGPATAPEAPAPAAPTSAE
ncbi:MAG: AI-2E family transporter [Sphingobium sp.]|nr:AI-2E family transporter [Sphingobium sp.]